MFYLRARYYNPDIGRFINEDPIKDGLNWYAYCDNEPVMRIDANGLEWGYIRDFVSNMEIIFGNDSQYIFTQSASVKIKLGGGALNKSGEFYFNGDIVVKNNGGRNSYIEHNKIYNGDGKLYLDRVDFYRAMNINYTDEFSGVMEVTSEGNIIAGAVGALAVSILTQGESTLVQIGSSVLSGAMISTMQRDPGEYKVRMITAKVKIRDGCYDTVTTSELYYKNPAYDEYAKDPVLVITTYTGASTK